MTQSWELGSLVHYINPDNSNALVNVTTATSSPAFGVNTRLIRVATQGKDTDKGVHVMVNANPTATSITAYIPNNTVEYIRVNPGDKLSAFADVAANVFITEISA